MHTFGGRITILFLAAIVCRGDAITQLSHFWEGDINTTDRILWDSHGSAHGMHTGMSGGLQAQTTVFGSGFSISVTPGANGVSVPGSLVATTGDFTIATWCVATATSDCIVRWRDHLVVPQQLQYKISWNSSRAAQVSGHLFSAATTAATKTNGAVGLIWMKVEGLQVCVALDAGSWTCQTASQVVTNDATYHLDFGHLRRTWTGGTTVGRTMMWKGYIPSDAERSAIYNGGNGRPYTYFNAAGFTKPPAPITGLTLVDSTFLDDANLTGQQGLYSLRPYNVCTMANNSFANGGNCYLWWRSTDHAASAGGLYYGWSSGPEVAPSSWTLAKNADNLDTDDPGATNWDQLETPWLEWNADTSTWHLYAHAGINGSSPYDQATVLYTSTNLSTWTFNSVAMPVGATVDGIRINHTGYAQVRRTGVNQWAALSLINDAVVGARFGLWTSTDGINWGTPTVTTCVDTPPPYSTYFCGWQNNAGTAAGAILGGTTNAAYMAYSNGDFGATGPFWRMIEHGGTQTGGDWLQGATPFCEGGTCWFYAKWSYQEPSVVRLYRGNVSNWFRKRLDGAVILSGGARLQ